MNPPCESCICLAICKTKYPNHHGNVWIIDLVKECDILSEYISGDMYRQERVDETKDILWSNTI